MFLRCCLLIFDRNTFLSIFNIIYVFLLFYFMLEIAALPIFFWSTVYTVLVRVHFQNSYKYSLVRSTFLPPASQQYDNEAPKHTLQVLAQVPLIRGSVTHTQPNWVIRHTTGTGSRTYTTTTSYSCTCSVRSTLCVSGLSEVPCARRYCYRYY